MSPSPYEQELDDWAGAVHGRVEAGEQEAGHSPAVVLAVDVEDGQHDQVGEDEGKHAAEADAAIPEHRGERDVADRADEADDRDNGADDRSPELGEPVVVCEKERPPPRV